MNDIFTFFYELSTYGWVAQSALFLSYPFAYLSIGIVLVWALCFSKNKVHNFILLSLSVTVSWLAAYGLKYLFHTVRPFIDLGIIPLYIENSFSFPSAHSALFASLAVMLLFINKTYGKIFLVIAILIGLSRMVIGVHYPIDVVAGWLLGALVSLVLIRVVKTK